MAGQSETADFIGDPVEYFDWSATRLWAMPRAEREAKQWEGLQLRFEQLRDRIGYLKKLADRDGVDSLDTLEDVIRFYSSTPFTNPTRRRSSRRAASA